MANAKPKRIVDEHLLALVRTLPCLACASLDPRSARENLLTNKNHAHHVKSRGAGGDDVASNLMPLCTRHHGMWHMIGMLSMAQKFEVVRDWLVLNGHLKG